MKERPVHDIANETAAVAGPLEVEQKYRVANHERVLQALAEFGAKELPLQQHCDLYLQHPCRDFAVSGEALRVRVVNQSAVVTYKGTRLPGPMKTRVEIELPLADQSHDDWLQIWSALGFRMVAPIRKQRRTFEVNFDSLDITIALDDVEQLGTFVEIEAIVRDRATLTKVQSAIQALAERLRLDQVEPRSYLRQIMEQRPSE